MKLPDDFQFSQSNLQNFLDCPRKFLLKGVYRLAWPAIAADPVTDNEHQALLGSRLHHRIYQSIIGIPEAQLDIPSQDEKFEFGWSIFKKAIRQGGSLHFAWQPGVQFYPEFTLNGNLGASHLVAKIDLIAVFPDGKISIFDWKTSHHPPHRSWLAERIQTRLYRFILTQAGKFLNFNHQIDPEQVEMIYWYISAPDTPIRLSYNQVLYQKDKEELQSFIDLVHNLSENEFHMTHNEKICDYCIYRSLCDRGVEAGVLTDFEQVPDQDLMVDIDLDFNQIDPIAF